MTTHDEMRKLAEAVPSKNWHAPGLAEVHDDKGRCIIGCVDEDPVSEDERPVPDVEEGEKIAQFIAAANPTQVIALLDEIRCWKERDEVLCNELSQLRAELEQVRKDAARYAERRIRAFGDRLVSSWTREEFNERYDITSDCFISIQAEAGLKQQEKT